MIFLNQLESYIETLFFGRINHYPLIRLVIFSLDKTLIYFIGLVLGQVGYLFYRKKNNEPINWWRQLILNIFIIYIIMLVHLTVLRYDWQWWDLSFNFERSTEFINLVPLVDTLKLLDGDSVFSYWYNFFGNVIWFVPFGLILPYLLRKKHAFFQIIGLALLMSLSIEMLQFWLETGVTHIDDVLFNVMGAILGYLGYDIIKFITLKTNHKKKENYA